MTARGQISADVERLAARLRQTADEMESAARYGVPIPNYISVSGHEHGNVRFSATEHEYEAWVEYAEAQTETYEHEGAPWSRAVADVNGLSLTFAVRHEAAEVTS